MSKRNYPKIAVSGPDQDGDYLLIMENTNTVDVYTWLTKKDRKALIYALKNPQ